jgi:nucleoside phosphorylase
MTSGDYKILEETVLLFWDTEENFRKEITQQKLIPDVYKEVILIDNPRKMTEVMERDFPFDQKFLFFVHLDHSNSNKGLDSFRASKIKKEFPGLAYYYVSSTSKSNIYEGDKNNSIDVFSYDNLHSDVENRFIIQTKAEISRSPEFHSDINEINIEKVLPQFDYAILTALYEDEFEELKKIFDFPSDETIKAKTKSFKVGYFKGNKNIKVIAGILNQTGPVEAAVVATMMLELFKPKYLLMPGVCGGAKKYKFGDIIVAKKIFAFQKGKISDHPSILDLPDEDSDQAFLFDVNKNPVDLKHLFDAKQNQVIVSVEKFELEHDAMIGLNTSIDDQLKDHLQEIKDKINSEISNDLRFSVNPPKIDIAIEPMASGTMVINKKGYFEEILKTVDRRVAAVEMESYGLARACQLANSGKTIPIIFKSVMDHTFRKEDAPGGTNVKKFAAYTSALFMKYLFEYKII